MRSATFGCLFPRRRGVTGMNPTVLTASLTGRIWFLCDLSEHYSPILHADGLESLSPLSGRSLGRCVSGTSPFRSHERTFASGRAPRWILVEPPRAT